MFDWTVADVLRKLRAESGILLKRLAKESGVALSTINRIETGRTQDPDRDTVRKIAAVFGLGVDEAFACVPLKHPGVPIRVTDSQLLQWKGERSRKRRRRIAVGER